MPLRSDAPATPTSTRAYLHQLDLFRVVTFAAVICVHVVSGVNDPESHTADAVEMMLHYTRCAFFALTGFVLVYQYRARPVIVRVLWRRRLALIGVPYLAWSVSYWLYSIELGYVPAVLKPALTALAEQIVQGTAWYHLYFLLVSLQVYALFPALSALVKKTVGHHGWVLSVSAALEVGMLWLLTQPHQPSGLAGQIWSHAYATVLPYQFFTVMGALAAFHYERMHAIVLRYWVALTVGTVMAAIVVQSIYWHAVGTGMPASFAAEVFQPTHLLWFVAIIVGLYAASSRWSVRRRPSSLLSRVIAYGSDRSFGIYLVHAMALQMFAPLIWPLRHDSGQVVATIVTYLGTLGLTVALAELVRRSPLAHPLTGRDRVRWRSLVLPEYSSA